MKQLITVLLFAIFAAGCGSDDKLVNAGGTKFVDETFTVSAGAFRPFSFSIDTDLQQNAFIQGNFEVKDGSISFAIMTESNYQNWQAGQSSSVYYSPGSVPGDAFRVNIDESDTYYLIFSNVQQTAAHTIEAEIFLFSTNETE